MTFNSKEEPNVDLERSAQLKNDNIQISLKKVEEIARTRKARKFQFILYSKIHLESRMKISEVSSCETAFKHNKSHFYIDVFSGAAKAQGMNKKF